MVCQKERTFHVNKKQIIPAVATMSLITFGGLFFVFIIFNYNYLVLIIGIFLIVISPQTWYFVQFVKKSIRECSIMIDSSGIQYRDSSGNIFMEWGQIQTMKFLVGTGTGVPGIVFGKHGNSFGFFRIKDVNDRIIDIYPTVSSREELLHSIINCGQMRKEAPSLSKSVATAFISQRSSGSHYSWVRDSNYQPMAKDLLLATGYNKDIFILLALLSLGIIIMIALIYIFIA